MTIRTNVGRTIVGCGLVMGLLTALSACAPAYYAGYPGYYPAPAYPRPYPHPPSQAATRPQPRSEAPQTGGDWVNPEPAK